MQAQLQLIELSVTPLSAEIYCVDPALAPKFWPMVESSFAKVLSDYPSDMTIESLEHDLLRGMQLLWIGWDGFKIVAGGTTELVQTPSHKVCSITAAFGVNTRLWDKFIPMIDQYARDEDCSRIRVSGRRGWKRVLKDFEEPWIVLERKLD